VRIIKGTQKAPIRGQTCTLLNVRQVVHVSGTEGTTDPSGVKCDTDGVKINHEVLCPHVFNGKTRTKMAARALLNLIK
jgi:hypothetical protein